MSPLDAISYVYAGKDKLYKPLISTPVLLLLLLSFVACVVVAVADVVVVIVIVVAVDVEKNFDSVPREFVWRTL